MTRQGKAGENRGARQANVREIALDVLLEILEKHQYSHLILRRALSKYQYLEKQDRSFIKRVTDGVLERLPQVDFAVQSYSSVPLNKMKPVIRTLLRLSAYQILFLDRVPDSAACNEAVKLAARRGFSGLKGFVNGVLRSLSRGKEELRWPDDPVKYCLPPWLWNKWEERYGPETAACMAESFLLPSRLTVRLNLNLASREEILSSLRDQGVEAEDSGSLENVVFLNHVDYLEGLDAFQDGLFQVQDLSSVLAGEAAGVKEGSYVIDVCGAPGGKSLHIASLLHETGMVEVRDISEAKIALVEENIWRSGFTNIEARAQDALVWDERSEGKADLVIADLPCSGLGILGRKPDIKYNMTEGQMEELSRLQRQILSVVHRYVKPGGVLLYSTCTVNPEENEENYRWLLSRFPFEPVDLRERLGQKLAGLAGSRLSTDTLAGGYIQLLPGFYPGDGFFLSVARRRQE